MLASFCGPGDQCPECLESQPGAADQTFGPIQHSSAHGKHPGEAQKLTRAEEVSVFVGG